MRKQILFLIMILLGLQIAIATTTITNCTELQNMKNNLSENYVLGNNINCAATSGWNGGQGFEPIGNDTNSFIGTFDGQGYNITGLFINRTEQGLGLFKYTESTTIIKNVGLINEKVYGDANYVGGLVGANGGTVINCFTTGEVSSTGSRLGGLLGYNGGPVTYSYSKSKVTDVVGNQFTGGLIGLNEGDVSFCYATGDVISNHQFTGGLIGINYRNIISCYATGNVNGGTYYTGGLVGSDAGPVYSSYATGNVTALYYVGSLIGWLEGGSIYDSYATGKTTGNSGVGGLIGTIIVGTVNNSYWDVCRTNQTTCTGAGTPSGCTGKNILGSETKYFYNITSPPMDVWDFDDVWNSTCNITGYPVLQNMSGQVCASKSDPCRAGQEGEIPESNKAATVIVLVAIVAVAGILLFKQK